MSNYSDWTNNIGGDEVMMTLTVEEDEIMFLNFSGDGVDLLIEDDSAAQQFFRSVAAIEIEWNEKIKKANK